MKIFLVRHGQTDLNEKGVFRGRLDVPLNERGKEQALAAAEKLSAYNIKKLYSSPLKRAVETAGIIADKLNIKTIIEEDFTDFDFGKWQGIPEEEISKLYPDLYMRWMNEPQKAEIPNGENLDLVRSRVSKALDRILDQGGENIAIVSHRVIIKIIICIALLLDNSYFGWIKIDTGEISVLEYENGLFTLPFSY